MISESYSALGLIAVLHSTFVGSGELTHSFEAQGATQELGVVLVSGDAKEAES